MPRSRTALPPREAQRVRTIVRRVCDEVGCTLRSLAELPSVERFIAERARPRRDHYIDSIRLIENLLDQRIDLLPRRAQLLLDATNEAISAAAEARGLNELERRGLLKRCGLPYRVPNQTQTPPPLMAVFAGQSAVAAKALRKEIARKSRAGLGPRALDHIEQEALKFFERYEKRTNRLGADKVIEKKYGSTGVFMAFSAERETAFQHMLSASALEDGTLRRWAEKHLKAGNA